MIKGRVSDKDILWSFVMMAIVSVVVSVCALVLDYQDKKELEAEKGEE